MAFRSTLRLEEIYFNNLRRLIDRLKNWKAGDNTEEITDILDSCIESNSAILLLYKNLGEEWNELTAIIKETEKKLEELRESVTSYHDELNEKIDSVNNLLNASIQSLETDFAGLTERVQALEDEKTVEILEITYDEEDAAFLADKNGEILTHSEIVEKYLDHVVILRYMETDEEIKSLTATYYMPYKIGNYDDVFGWYGVPVQYSDGANVSSSIGYDVVILEEDGSVSLKANVLSLSENTPVLQHIVNTAQEIPSDVTDLNLVKNGLYYVRVNDVSNAPTTTNGICLRGAFTNIAFQFYLTVVSRPELFYRVHWSGVSMASGWSNWLQVSSY